MSLNADQCRAFLRRRRQDREAALEARFQEAWRDCRAIVDLLLAKYQPRRVYQWGSLLHRDRFSEISDIDIAVEGISGAAQFFALFGEADRLTRITLDLVDLDHVEPEFAELIRLKGVMVYDRENPNPGPHYRN